MPFAPYTGYVPYSQTSLSCKAEELHSKQSDKRMLGLLLRTIFCAIPLIKDRFSIGAQLLKKCTLKFKAKNTHLDNYLRLLMSGTSK